MDIRTCENCVFYFPVIQATGQSKQGQCRKAPRVSGDSLLLVDLDEWCGEGKFLSTTINPAGSQRMYDFIGNAGGFYHNILDE